MKKVIKSLMALWLLILPACSTMTNGNVHLLRTSDNRLLYGPWNDGLAKDGVVPKAGKEFDPTMRDAFTLYFNQAFFKYLTDPMNANEVIVLFTFYEGHDETSKLVKILGPMKKTADRTFSSWLDRVSYGPTRLEKDFLTVEIDVIEYDVEESNNQAAFLDFLGNAAETFNLANPVTAAEIKVAKEIGKTLLAMNKNDQILQIKFDLVPYDSNVWNSAAGPQGIPLRAGTWAVIKQETDGNFLDKYFYFTRRSADNRSYGEWLVTPFLDLLLTPAVLGRQLFTDVPDNLSVHPLTTDPADDHYQDDEKDIELNRSDKKLYSIEKSEIKTEADEERLKLLTAELNVARGPVSHAREQYEKTLVSREEIDRKTKSLEKAERELSRTVELLKARSAEQMKESTAEKSEPSKELAVLQQKLIETITARKEAKQRLDDIEARLKAEKAEFDKAWERMSTARRDVDAFRKDLQITVKKSPYQSKTWLTFSIEQGGDAKTTSYKKIMTAAEQKMLGLIKNADDDSIGKSALPDAINALNDARSQVKKMQEQTGFRLIKPENVELQEADTAKGTDIEIQIPESVGKKKESVKLRLGKKKPNQEDPYEWVHSIENDRNISTIDARFKVSEALQGGHYDLLLDYENGQGEMRTAKLPFKVASEPQKTDGKAKPQQAAKGEKLSRVVTPK